MSDTRPTSAPEQAVDAAGLAQMLSISLWKAREHGKDPLFPSFREGRQHRFWPSEVIAYTKRPTDDWAQSARSRGRKRTGR